MSIATQRRREAAPSYPQRLRRDVEAGLARLFAPTLAHLPTPAWRDRGRLTVWAVVIVVSIAGSMMFVDAAAVMAARELPHSVLVVFGRISAYGKSSWVLWPLGTVLLVLALLGAMKLERPAREAVAMLSVRFGFIFLAVAVPGVIVAIVKRIIGRGRPYVTDPVDPFAYLQLVWRADYASFPSGHATTAFGVLVAVGVVWPRLLPVLWIYALAVAGSRVVVGAHYPSDVIAGAVVGTVGALLVRDWFAARGLGFAVDARGVIWPKPGPSFVRLKSIVAGERA